MIVCNSCGGQVDPERDVCVECGQAQGEAAAASDEARGKKSATRTKAAKAPKEERDEDRPTFKVTDRRLFNPDGTTREDVMREEEEAAAREQARVAAAAASSVAAAESETSRQGTPDTATPPQGASERAAAGGEFREAESGGVAGGVSSEDDDPQEFLMVVEFIASFAAEALGMTERPPAGGKVAVNLPLAKQCIDMLGTLERKTRGNLNAEERHYFDLILSQLRMQYVSLSGAPRTPAAPRGFSGSDITGGR